MSAFTTNWVLAYSPTENALRMVLCVLAAAAAEADGSGAIRLGTIAKQAKLAAEPRGREQAKAALDLLEQEGHISYEMKEPGSTTAYFIVLVDQDWLAMKIGAKSTADSLIGQTAADHAPARVPANRGVSA